MGRISIWQVLLVVVLSFQLGMQFHDRLVQNREAEHDKALVRITVDTTVDELSREGRLSP